MTTPSQLDSPRRRYAVPIVFAALLAVTAIVFWRPLLDWFGGGSRPGTTGPSGEPPADEQPENAANPAGSPGETAAESARAAHAGVGEAPALPPLVLPEPALAALQDGFAAYEVVRAQLAQDRLQAVAAPARLAADKLRATSSALAGESAPASDALARAAAAADRVAGATTFEQARREFGEMTRFLVALAMADERLRAGRHLFSCPMVDGGYGKWLQTSRELENPYMGTSMATCGTVATWTAAAPRPDPAGEEAGRLPAGRPQGPASAAAADPAATTAAGGVSHAGHGHRGSDVSHYTCAMHPSVQQKTPGQCPICAMELSPVTYEELESGVVRVDEARRRRIGVQTSKAVSAPMSISIRALGRLTYDETRLKDVTLKVKGWVARLRVNSTGQPVRRGETLFALYSPELYAAQQEYLLALESQRASGQIGMAGRSDYLVKAAEKKLRLWDVTSAQLAELARRGEPIEEIPILAPASGYVIEKDVVEGAAVEPGQRLYRIASLDKVWVETQVYELDLARVRKGQKAVVTLPYQPGEALTGTVAYVYPYLDPTSRTGRVRIELPNKDLAFKPDMYANVELRIDLGERLQIPVDAVIYTGPRRLVFVDLGEDRLRPQEVRLGARNGESVEILSGLRAGESIVTSANFLIAAESRIRSAAQMWADEADVGNQGKPAEKSGQAQQGGEPTTAPAGAKGHDHAGR